MKQRNRINRLYLPELSTAGAVAGEQAVELALPSGEVHHALHVLRLREGEEVEVFDGQGRQAVGRVARIGRNEATVQVPLPVQLSQRPTPRVHLAFALPKGERLDWLLEKATELGVASLWPVVCERSTVGREEASPAKRQRWLGHCISAAKQCGLDFLPELGEGRELEELLAQGPRGLGLVGDLSPRARKMREVVTARVDDLTLLVGPEGGLTDDELDRINRAGFASVRLGQTTLRVETAGVAMIAAVVAMIG